MSDEAKVVEMEDVKETKNISDEDLKELQNMAGQANEMHASLGGLAIHLSEMEGKKMEIISEIYSAKEKIDEKAKQSIKNAGIPEEELGKYTIDIQNGALIPRE